MHDTPIRIAPMERAHWPWVRRIYEQGIDAGFATFETSTPDWKDWNAAHLQRCRLVALRGERVVGWAALSPVSDRCVYGGVAEVSIYVDRAHHRRGVGSRLMRHVIKESEVAGIWTLQAGVFPANVASLELARRAGFRVVGVRERLGKLEGRWHDVVLMERRSDRIGLD